MAAVTARYIDGQLVRDAAPREPEAQVTEDDARSPEKLARVMTQAIRDIETLKRRSAGDAVEFVDVWCPGDGKPVQLSHQLGGRVRATVSSWRAPGPGVDFASSCMWVRRPFFGPMTLLNAAGAFTNANHFKTYERSLIGGVRFAWRSSGAAATGNVKLWRVSSGLQVASGPIAVDESGVYQGYFTRPFLIEGADLGVDFAASFYIPGSYSYTAADAAFEALLPMRMPGCRLESIIKYGVGDAFPNLNAGVARYWVEPIFCDPNPEIVEDASLSTENILFARTYSPGYATIRVELL